MIKPLRRAVDRAYGATRGLDGGLDPALSDAQVISFAAEKIALRLVGLARGYRNSYIAPSARLRGRAQLRLGEGVALGAHTLIDARSHAGIQIGDSSTIDACAVLRASGVLRHLGVGIHIGSRTSVGFANFLHGGGGLDIGDDCLLGPNVQVFSENHVSGDLFLPIREQGEHRAQVRIGNDVWIGAGATILAGVTVGEGAIVAAGAIVTRDVDQGSIVAGVPAKAIGRRGSK